MKPTAKSMAVVKRTLPCHMVPSQLKIMMPVGMEMLMVEMLKIELTSGPMPVVNMWWLQTMKERKERRISEPTSCM